MTQVTPVVVDEGSAQIKVCWYDADKQCIRQHKILSMVSRNEMDGVDGLGNFHPSSYRIGGRELYLNPKMQYPDSTKSADYQVSLNNRALVHEALRQAGFGGQTVQVYCTLPVTQFFTGNRLNEKLISEKKKNLMGEIDNMGGAELATISQCRVSPESIPAWYHLLIDEKNSIKGDRLAANAVLIVDLGGTTIDITLIDGEGNPKKTFSMDLGVFDVTERLRNLIIQQGKINSVPQIHMDTLLRTGQYRNTDVSALINQASLPVRDMILSKMKEFANDPWALDHIVYVGGGAALMGKELASDYGNLEATEIPENPDMAVAMGLIKSELLEQAEPA
ncbi:MAG: plasmid segregation protein ParM domain-containing protein [Endozoicomonas sp.]